MALTAATCVAVITGLGHAGTALAHSSREAGRRLENAIRDCAAGAAGRAILAPPAAELSA